MASQSASQTALRELMDERDMRPEQLAIDLGVSVSSVMRWRSGRVSPTRGMAERLAVLFKVDRSVFAADPDSKAAA